MYIKPTDGPITSFMGPARSHPVIGSIRPHQGVDIGSADDNRVWAAAGGTVYQVGYSPKSAGNFVLIKHSNGQTTSYSHLARVDVQQGQRVTQGQRIGMKGSTGLSSGVHLHFEIAKADWTNSFSNKLNPLLYFIDPETKQFQACLKELGYDVDVDGYYGEKTITAVALYQKRNGLEVDGYAGRTTYAALKADTAQQVAAAEEEVKKEEDNDLKFSSGSLKNELDFSLHSKAHRQMIIDAAIEQGYSQVHAERLSDGTIEDGDLLALASGALIKSRLANK